jgi:RNA polymerase sigma factor (sigma-70 family)
MLPQLKNLIESDATKPLPEEVLNQLFTSGDHDKIILSFLRLIRARASKRFFKGGRFSFDDLFMNGYTGLIDSLKTYQPTKGRMTVWCYRYIDGYMQNSLKHKQDNDTVSENTETTSDDDGAQSLINTIADDTPNSFQIELISDDLDKVRQILTSDTSILSDLEKTVLNLRFGLTSPDQSPMTLDEIGTKLNYTKVGIKFMIERSLEKIHRQLAA